MIIFSRFNWDRGCRFVDFSCQHTGFMALMRRLYSFGKKQEETTGLTRLNLSASCGRSPGSVLEKKLTGGLGLFFGSEIFDILIFLGLEKSLLFCWV